MAEIKIFENESFGKIRVAGTSEEPLFCLADICKAIEISKSRNVKERLDDEDVCLVETPTPGGPQSLLYVTEAGMYDVVIRSDRKKARSFSRWITHEVLIELRKTGYYSVNKSTQEVTVKDRMQAATWAAEFLNLNESSKLLMAKRILDPLNLPLPDYTPSKGILKSASELLESRGIKISAQIFNKKAIEKGFLCELERDSSNGKKKRFKSITEKGLEFGENQVNPNNPKSTQPLWYDNKFNKFIDLLGINTND